MKIAVVWRCGVLASFFLMFAVRCPAQTKEKAGSSSALRAAGATQSSTQAAGSDAQFSSIIIHIPDLWYFQDRYNELWFGSVAGGTGQSGAGMVIQDQFSSENLWCFVTGQSLTVHPTMLGGSVTTTVPGFAITSTQSYAIPPPTDERKWITMKLLTVHDVDPAIIHVPLLLGNTWGAGPLGTGGATYGEAVDTLSALGLTFTANQTRGRVVAQIPAGGTTVAAGTQVQLTLVGDEEMPDALGDTPAAAIPVTGPGYVRGEISIANSDSVKPKAAPGCHGRGRDVFFVLPAGVKAAKKLSVSEASSEMVVLSVWTYDSSSGDLVQMTMGAGDPACSRTTLGSNPQEGFTHDVSEASVSVDPSTVGSGRKILVMVEHQRRDTAMFRLKFFWQ